MWKQAFIRGFVVLSLLGLILPAAFPGNAYADASANGEPLVYATDRTVYTQGDVVKISVTNTSDAPVTIVDRTHIDGGFAAVRFRIIQS